MNKGILSVGGKIFHLRTYDASYDFGFLRSRACVALPFAENPHSKADSKGVPAAEMPFPRRKRNRQS